MRYVIANNISLFEEYLIQNLVNFISRVQLQTVGFYYILSKLVGSSALHVGGSIT